MRLEQYHIFLIHFSQKLHVQSPKIAPNREKPSRNLFHKTRMVVFKNGIGRYTLLKIPLQFIDYLELICSIQVSDLIELIIIDGSSLALIPGEHLSTFGRLRNSSI